ncbi:MAG: hypothetical protein HFE63_09485 [Clostridiales bacterium]|nr:hypothetical protein [Clostridiales bacterium]
MNSIIVKNLRLPIDAPIEESFQAAKKRLALSQNEYLSAKLHKRSIDARHRVGNSPEFVCSVTVDCEISEKKLQKIASLGSDFEIIKNEPLTIETGNELLDGRPLIVGFGPCGMFAALLLAENGYNPLVIERGGDVSQRIAAVEEFNRSGQLDTETNIQFGAGGAGTFSDGKLVTRINDPRCSYVLERFRDFGAPDEICYLAKPHIGTDKLLGVVDGIRQRIESLGGEIRFNTKLNDIEIVGNKVRSARLESDGISSEIKVGAVILAVGHSARDTYDMLAAHGVELMPKPFSVGVRVEHLQSDIDAALYGKFADKVGKDGKKLLPPGEYALSWREPQKGLKSDTARGVYSFCMCPGGEVVAAASECGGVVTNGMSRYARDGRNANAAIAVSVFPEDIGGGWHGGIEFQRMLEQKAFKAAGSNYSAPVETLGDFLDGKRSHFTEPKRIIPTYRGGIYTLCDLSDVLPDFVSGMLKKGFPRFAGKVRGFNARDAVLTGVETRTSAPIRIPRGETRTASAADNLYPCGEGAGYAGGITSAAVDGINTALQFMKVYRSDR